MARVLALVLVALAAVGCGAKHGATTTNAPSAPTTAAPQSGTVSTTTSAISPPAPLQAEAASAAAGDIPDNQVFVRYTGPRFTMKYPEGWAQSVQGSAVVIRDKNNIVRVVIAKGGPSTPSSMRAGLESLHGVSVSTPPHAVTLAGHAAVAATYRTRSAPSPVTGKRVTLSVDRYELAHGGYRATVDLGTPVGVDNVDAYRLMIESFRWR
jgi:hypothetical protein